ncbi:MAG: cupin domain-containing protein [Ilumatobacteraceae bacterium]
MGDERNGWGSLDAPTTDGVYARRPDEHAIPTPSDDVVHVLADGSNTRGLASFLEYRLSPRASGPPVHWHAKTDELFYVVSGQLAMRSGDNDQVLGPRDFAFVPRGAPHTFSNPTDDETVFVSAWTPAGAEQAWLIAHHLIGEFGLEGIPPERLAELMEVADTIVVEPTTA